MRTTAPRPRPPTAPPSAEAAFPPEGGPRVTLPLRRTVPREGPTRGRRAIVRTACLLLIAAGALLHLLHLLQVAQVVSLPLAITVLLNLVWGFGGALIAIPLLLVAHAVADHIDGLRPIALPLRL